MRRVKNHLIMAKEEAAPLSPVKHRLSPTKQRKDTAPSPSEPRPLITLLRFVCGALCFLGGIGCLAAALPIIFSAGPDLEIAQIVRTPRCTLTPKAYLLHATHPLTLASR